MWSRRVGLNHRPADYESAALPLSYAGLLRQVLSGARTKTWRGIRTEVSNLIQVLRPSVNSPGDGLGSKYGRCFHCLPVLCVFCVIAVGHAMASGNDEARNPMLPCGRNLKRKASSDVASDIAQSRLPFPLGSLTFKTMSLVEEVP